MKDRTAGRSAFIESELLTRGARERILHELMTRGALPRDRLKNAEQFVRDVEAAFGDYLAAVEMSRDEPTWKQSKADLLRLSGFAEAIVAGINTMPRGTVETLARSVGANVPDALDYLNSIREQLGPLITGAARIRRTAHKGGRPHSEGALVALTVTVGRALKAVGVDPDEDAANPLRSIVEFLINKADPERRNPDVGRYINKALPKIRSD